MIVKHICAFRDRIGDGVAACGCRTEGDRDIALNGDGVFRQIFRKPLAVAPRLVVDFDRHMAAVVFIRFKKPRDKGFRLIPTGRIVVDLAAGRGDRPCLCVIATPYVFAVIAFLGFAAALEERDHDLDAVFVGKRGKIIVRGLEVQRILKPVFVRDPNTKGVDAKRFGVLHIAFDDRGIVPLEKLRSVERVAWVVDRAAQCLDCGGLIGR